MTESTVDQYAARTNGHVHLSDEVTPAESDEQRRGSLKSKLVPIVIIVAALIMLRRMQAGNYA
jgi:hypothetical protein